MNYRKYLSAVLCAFAFNNLPFGEGWGEACAQKVLKDTTLYVVKTFQGTIADASRINDMPEVRDSIPPVPKIAYNIQSKKVHTPVALEPMNAAKMTGEPLTRLYPGLIKLGGGNYNTPYANVFYHNLRSKDISWGASAGHISSQADLEGYGFGGYSNNNVNANIKKFLYRQTFSAAVDYDREVVHYYGFDTSSTAVADNDYIKQRYALIGAQSSLQSHYTDSLRFNHLINLRYYNLRDYHGGLENFIHASGDVSGFYEKQLIHAPLIFEYGNLKNNADTSWFSLVTLSPHILSKGDKWSTKLGMNITLDSRPEKSRFLFHPNVEFEYNVLRNIIIPYGGFAGKLQNHMLRSIVQENPFVVPSPDLRATNDRWEMYGGIKGSITTELGYNARCSFRRTENLNLFVNDNSDLLIKGFNLIYDNASILNLHGEMHYQHTEKIKVVAEGDYFSYDMENELRAWHRPAWQVGLRGNYNLKDKILASVHVFANGNRYAYAVQQGQGTGINVVSSSILTLKPVLDASLGLEYRYSKKLSGFISLNNLAFKRYYQWHNYPTYKFNFLAGVTMGF